MQPLSALLTLYNQGCEQLKCQSWACGWNEVMRGRRRPTRLAGRGRRWKMKARWQSPMRFREATAWRVKHDPDSGCDDSCCGCARDGGLVHDDRIQSDAIQRRRWRDELGEAVLWEQRSDA